MGRDDPARAPVRALLEEHLRHMHSITPPESVHALDLDALRAPGITFWTARAGDSLLGCCALRELDPAHGEIKSMRTPDAWRGYGIGRAMLVHLIAVARARGYRRLSLETGSMAEFVAAQRLYASHGFEVCGPFADYGPDPNSLFMTRGL
ncbi:MAG: GNAT family N-acetyltransferase [Burkholderiaceae bacterium]